MEGAVLGGMLCGLIIGLAIGTLIGAVILRAAVALYNKFAGGDDGERGVPEPSFGKAMGITFVTSLVNLIVAIVIGIIIGGGAPPAVAGEAPAAQDRSTQLISQLVGFPFSLIVMAAMLSAMLPTTFGRAFLVTLCYMLVVLLIVAVIFVAMMAFGVALGG